MSILSITFHCTKDKLDEWEIYTNKTLTLMADNLIDVNHYILSEVHSDFIEDGKNYNLLLLFDDDEKRTEFMESEMLNIAESVEKKFGQEIMIFNTFLNPKKMKI